MIWDFLNRIITKRSTLMGANERDDCAHVLHRRQFVTKLLDLQHRCMFLYHVIVFNNDEQPLIL